MQNNNFARASRFFVHFFAVTARRRLEVAWLLVLWRAQISDVDFFLLFLNLSAVRPYEKNLGEIHPHFTFSANWYIYTRDKVWKKANSF